MLFGAPDLAFTQFMVETLSVVILALVMTRLRLVADRSPAAGAKACSTAAIALACGIGFGLLLLMVTRGALRRRADRLLRGAFATPIAHGRNIVNVILVDFRGLDTLGEISVVMTAGIAILALIRVPTPAARGRPEAAGGRA